MDILDTVVADDSGELSVVDDTVLSEEEAQEITSAIRSAATATWVLLARAHEGKAYRALGYSTWAEYVSEEFDMSAQRSYQLLDLSKAVKLIEDNTPEGTEVKLTEAQARDIKRELPRITERIHEETRDQSPEDASDTVDEIINEVREQKKEENDAVALKEKSIDDALEEGRQKGLEEATDAFLAQADEPEKMDDSADHGFLEMEVDGSGDSLSPETLMNLHNFFSILENVTSLPDPDEFIDTIPEGKEDEVENQILQAAAWFNRFSTLWEEKMSEDDESL